MQVSELIYILQGLQKNHGDLDIHVCESGIVEEVQFKIGDEEVKETNFFMIYTDEDLIPDGEEKE